MKLLLLIASLIFSDDESTRNDGNKFRVIGLKNKVTIVSTSAELALLDLFNDTETIEIGKDSYIAFIDDAINVFEYYGPIIIKTDTLKGRSKRETYKKQKLGSYPDFKLVDSDTKLLIDPIIDSNRKFQIYYPYPFSHSFLIRNDSILNIKWKDGGNQNQGEYNFLLFNVFGDLIEKQKGIENAFHLNLWRIKSPDKLYFFISRDNKDSIKTSDFTIMFSDIVKTHDVTLNDKSPASNFITALFLEKNGLIEEAGDHYLKAASLGVGLEPYNKVLVKFKKRWNR